MGGARTLAQQPAPASPAATSAAQDPSSPNTPQPSGSGKTSSIDTPQPKIAPDDTTPPQTKRILWIIPNFRSVSTTTYLPPLSVKEKFWLATQDSFDYSSFIYVGILAGISMAGKGQPSFGDGAAAYGQYYAHDFADNAIENYFVESIVPAMSKEDPRYYTLGSGGIFKRTGYSVSRLFITRTDSRKSRFNISEIVGAGAAAGIGNLYYPSTSNLWVKTYQRWISQVGLDGLSFVAKEFWPDINRALFHNKY